MSEPKMRRVRIVHDGSPSSRTMRILDAETGEQIRYVTRVEFVADASGEIKAVLSIVGPELDVIVNAIIDERSAEERIADRVLAQLAPQLDRIERQLLSRESKPTIGPFLAAQE
jgi:hypothetical protein